MAELLFDKSSDWLLQKLYNANRADYETFRVYKCFSRYIHDNREFIGITEQVTPTSLRFKPLTDLADDCLFGVSLFSRTIKRRQQYKGAPGIRFYTYTGKNAFSATGYGSISNHWDFWVEYVNNAIKFDK